MDTPIAWARRAVHVALEPLGAAAPSAAIRGLARAVALVLCLASTACAGRPAIGVVITNSPEGLECSLPAGRGTCR